MTHAKYVLPAIVMLVAACRANPAPTQPPGPTLAPSVTPIATVADASDNLGLTLAPGIAVTLVRVPAGDFVMGSSDGDVDAGPEEKPQHTVTLAEYLIGKYDVTNAQYAVFVQSTHRIWTRPAGRDNHPVVNITWADSVAFCQWLSTVTGRKVQLPSEAQWEKAARGPDGRLYPWGNDAPTTSRLNFNNDVNDTTPVGQYSPQGDSPYGVSDATGNVYQWTSSLKRPYPYRTDDGRDDLSSHDWRVVRGGGFIVGLRGVRSAARSAYDPIGRYDDVGFRVVVVPRPE